MDTLNIQPGSHVTYTSTDPMTKVAEEGYFNKAEALMPVGTVVTAGQIDQAAIDDPDIGDPPFIDVKMFIVTSHGPLRLRPLMNE